jgi:branched-chain amino acid transport system substrate-binding protein
MRAFKLVSIVVLLALALAACAQPAPASAPAAPAATSAPQAAASATQPPASSGGGGTIKVAVLAPITGSNATFGQSTKEGALMAIDEWNAKGGVAGMKIVASVEDGQCKPDPAVNAANKIISQDGIHYIIGEVCSSASIPVSKIATANKVIQISPTSTNDALTVGADGKPVPYIFRACYNDSFQGQVIANFAAQNLKFKTAFILTDQSNPYTVGLSNSFEKAFTNGTNKGTIAGKENYTGTDTDFSAILAKVAAAAPDMVLLPDYYPVVNLMYKQAKEKGITAPFMGGDGWDSSDLDRTAADGGYYSNHYDPGDPRPEVQNFIKAYGAKYKDDKGNAKVPDALGTLAYDAANMLLTSINNAGADNTDKVQDALLKLSLSGVSGKITVDPNTHNPVKAAVIEQVKGGKINYVTTVNP